MPAAISHVASPPLKLTSFKVRNAQAWAALTVAGRFQWNNTSVSLNTTCPPSTWDCGAKVFKPTLKQAKAALKEMGHSERHANHSYNVVSSNLLTFSTILEVLARSRGLPARTTFTCVSAGAAIATRREVRDRQRKRAKA